MQSNRNLNGNSPRTKQATSSTPQYDIFTFTNLSSQLANTQQDKSKKELLYFNGVSYNINFNTPRTLTSCLELGVTKEFIQEQMQIFEKMVNPPKNEPPEITQMKLDHYTKRISGKKKKELKKKLISRFLEKHCIEKKGDLQKKSKICFLPC